MIIAKLNIKILKWFWKKMKSKKCIIYYFSEIAKINCGTRKNLLSRTRGTTSLFALLNT